MKHNYMVAGIAILNVSVLSGCVSFPPRYDKNPHVVVEYKCTALLPGASEALFIKNVTQLVTKPREESSGIPPFMTSHWTFHEEQVWRKTFICSANINSGEKKVVREWPQELSQPEGLFRVSRPLRRAVFLCGSNWQNHKIVVMDLDTFNWRYIAHPNAPYSAPSANSLALSPDEKEFAVGICSVFMPNTNTPVVQGIAICNFDNQMRFLATGCSPSIEWLQKRNLIRLTMSLKHFATIDPVSLSIVEERTVDNVWDMPSISRDEMNSPLDAEFPPRKINLGTPGSHNGSFSPSKAATLW